MNGLNDMQLETLSRRPRSGRRTGLLRTGAVFTALVTLGLLASEAWAAAYFVDSVSGSDANAGTSQTAPWKSVPGMSGVSSWGSITSSNKVAAGSTIDIKAGSSFTGKRWLVDTTYYQTGTSTSPITIRVSPSWGSGNVVIDGSGVSVPQWNAGVQITNISYITIAGADATRRLEIKNYSAHAAIMHYQSGSGSTRAVGNQLKWFNCHHASTYCVANVWQDSLLYEDGIVHDNGTGVVMGDVSDATGDNDVVRRVVSYNNGAGARPNDGSVSFGFQTTGGVNTLFDSCEAYGNGRDGFDAGRADNAGNASMTFLNSYSHDNGEDGFGLNSGPTGNVTAVHINTISARNGQANWTIYDGAHIEIYNSVGRASVANIHAFKSFSNWPAPTVKIRNSYMSAASGVQIHYYNPGALGYPVFNSDYNLWVPNSSNSETFDDDKMGNYTSPPTWKGANDKFGVAYTQTFTNLAGDNFHLASATGPAVKAGQSLSLLGLVSSLQSLISKDRDGKTRISPPDIGPYQYGTATPSALAPPANLRVMQ